MRGKNAGIRMLGQTQECGFVSVLTCRPEVIPSCQNQAGSKERLLRRRKPQATQRQSKKCPSVNHVRKQSLPARRPIGKSKAEQRDNRPQPPSAQYASPSHVDFIRSFRRIFETGGAPGACRDSRLGCPASVAARLHRAAEVFAAVAAPLFQSVILRHALFAGRRTCALGRHHRRCRQIA